METKVRVKFKPGTTEETRERVSRMVRKLANTDQAQNERMANANKLLHQISSCGRGFFGHQGRVSQFELDGRGRLCFRDKYSNVLLLTWYTKSNAWHVRFTEGGTLKAVVEKLIDYIKNGTLLPSGIFGPWPAWYSEGDPWGYGDAMESVRTTARQFNMILTAHNDNYHPTD